MERNLLKLLFVLLLSAFAGSAAAQFSSNRKFDTLEKFGNDRAAVRVLADYSRVGGQDEFWLVYAFDVSFPWYVYSEKKSEHHRPLAIDLHLPEGMEVVDKVSPQGTDREGNEVYSGDFAILFKIRTDGRFRKDAEIRAGIVWQCCDGRLCTMGDVDTHITIRSGEPEKSPFYRNIRKILD